MPIGQPSPSRVGGGQKNGGSSCTTTLTEDGQMVGWEARGHQGDELAASL